MKEYKYCTIKVQGEELILLPERAVFWARRKSLLVSDLHLGKSGHFRKAGIALPSSIHHNDLGRLSKLIHSLHAETVYILGDLFHSVHNREWNYFLSWRKVNAAVEMHLIKGNHDILSAELLREASLTVHQQHFEVPPFLLIHDHCNVSSSLYRICGHIHPAIHFHGKAKQHASLPCFWFGKDVAVLPAFGNFTGNAIVSPLVGDRVFYIGGDEVHEYITQEVGISNSLQSD